MWKPWSRLGNTLMPSPLTNSVKERAQSVATDILEVVILIFNRSMKCFYEFLHNASVIRSNNPMTMP